MTVEDLIRQLDRLSTKELERLGHAVSVALDERDALNAAEQCVAEMICQRCEHELDCLCGCSCLCHEMV